MLDVSDYHVAYGESEVLHGIDFAVGEGEIVSVLGRNGMGKSTLMKSLSGLLPTRTGKAVLDGRNITHLKSHQRVAAGLGYVPQGRMIFPALTVEENLRTGLVSTEDASLPADIHELFPVLEEMRARRGGNLSGGQQQQLAIGRALATGPRVLLLDEPTEGIQPSIIRELAQVLKRIRDTRQLAIVVSEQVLSFALEVADRVLVLENGRLVHEATRDNVNEAQLMRFLSV